MLALWCSLSLAGGLRAWCGVHGWMRRCGTGNPKRVYTCPWACLRVETCLHADDGVHGCLSQVSVAPFLRQRGAQMAVGGLLCCTGFGADGLEFS